MIIVIPITIVMLLNNNSHMSYVIVKKSLIFDIRTNRHKISCQKISN